MIGGDWECPISKISFDSLWREKLNIFSIYQMGNSKSDMVPPETQKNEIKEGQRESYDEEIDPDFDFPKVNFTITTFLLH